MQRKKVISFILMLVLSLQFLPLRQMVSWLISNQVTEEIVHGMDSSKTEPGPDEVHKYVGSAHQFTLDLFAAEMSNYLRHEDEAILARFADDIPTPPPNI